MQNGAQCEAVNGADETVRPRFSIETLDAPGRLRGGAYGVAATGSAVRKHATEKRTLKPTTQRQFKQHFNQQMTIKMLRDGLLKSASHKSQVHIGIPLDALNILFPNLYPEAAAISLE